MSNDVSNMRVACLVADGFEQVELTDPVNALRDAGALVSIVSPAIGQVRGWQTTEWGADFDVDVFIDDARADDFDALLLPGGVMNPDKLRLSQESINFINTMAGEGKPIAAICHGPWTLINANLVKGKKMTSWPSIRLDLENAGAEWVDETCVRDGMLVTSRKPADLPAFNEAMLAMFAESRGSVNA
jgi:protease I